MLLPNKGVSAKTMMTAMTLPPLSVTVVYCVQPRSRHRCVIEGRVNIIVTHYHSSARFLSSQREWSDGASRQAVVQSTLRGATLSRVELAES